ncbi:lysozyme inhibitor LprI family protein [Novosphingobium sp.]|uniref:lysozyme inhibitor LprI family protein n=1 Tax=Novosphingobium sp. TaxID=1874826 RepID=UPI0035B20402
MGMLAAALLLAPAAPSAVYAMQSSITPSFSCEGRLSPTETAICQDFELAAWDRAMAKIYPLLKKQSEITLAEHRRWLGQRDACGADAKCILSAYRKWPGFDANVPSIGSSFHRKDTDFDDTADMTVLHIFGDWYYFSIMALHVQVPPEGVNDGQAWGLIELKNGKATYDEAPGEDYSCRFHLQRISASHWSVEEFGENTVCGGLNVFLTGDYVRSARSRH